MRSIAFDVSIPRVLATQALSRVWSGAYYAPTAPVRLRELEVDGLPGPRGVEVQNRMCGICASDLHLLFCDVHPKVHPAALPGRDRIYLGHEVVSEVVRVGDDVEALAPGDRVAMMTRFLGATCRTQERDDLCPACARGDYALCENQAAGGGAQGVGGGWGDRYTCHVSELWPVPDDLDDEAATLVEPLACGVRAALRRLPEAGERALVIGCGTIGLATAMAVRALSPDAEVYAAARYPQQKARAEEMGATVIEDDLLQATADITDARLYSGPFGNRTLLGGFDVIYDCVASSATLGQAVRMTRAGGAAVMVGVHMKPSQLDLTPVLFQEVDLIGAMAHGVETWEGESMSTFDLTATLMREYDVFDPAGFITHRFALDDWREAIDTAVDKRTGCIKVVFDRL